MMKYFTVIAGCLIALAGCKAERSPSSFYGPDASGILVVDAVLIVDKPLPDLFIRQTANAASFSEHYSSRRSGVTDAEVVITQDERAFFYRADPNEAGRYLPPPNAPIVLPHTAYELHVRSQGREARAQTLTPDRLDIREAVLLDAATLEVTRVLKKYKDGDVFRALENRVPYQSGLLEVRFDPLPVSGYHIAIESLDPTSDPVTDSDFFDPEDFERYGSSPAFEAHDGTVRLPWFAVGFVGPYVIRIYAVDKNWFDLVRSVPEFFQDGDERAFQPGGLAGDNFERPLFRIEGGIGLFGSAAVDSLGFVVLPRHTDAPRRRYGDR